MAWKPRTIGILAMGAVVVLGLGYVTFREEPVLVDLFEVTQGPMQVTINADGITRIREVYDVSSPITGTALRSPVDVGDVVVAGETVVAVVEPIASGLLDSRSRAQAEAAVQEAEAALHVAEADLAKAMDDRTLASSQFERAQILVEREVASFTRLEDAAQRLAVAEASVEAAQARIDMATGTLTRALAVLEVPEVGGEPDPSCCVPLYSPVDGVVLAVADQSERSVSTGALLVSLGDPAELELVVDLLSVDAVRLAEGAYASIDRWGGNKLLDARLSRISPAASTQVSALGIEEQRVDAIFDLISPREDRPSLGHGFAVFARIVEWSADEATQVPLSAIFKRGEDWSVFVGNDGVIEERRIEIGQQNERMAQVMSGLTPGELVVTHPNDTIAEGVTYALRESFEQ